MARKDQKMIGLWVPCEQHEQFMRAAKRDGFSLTDWIRGLCAREVAPKATPLLPKMQMHREALTMIYPAVGNKKTAAELVASIPGVRLGGFGGIDMAMNPQEALDGANALIDKWAQEPYYVGNAPVEEITTKPWLPLWTKLVQKINDDPDSFYEEVKRLCPGFKPTQAFWKLPIERQAAALDEKYPLEAE